MSSEPLPWLLAELAKAPRTLPPSKPGARPRTVVAFVFAPATPERLAEAERAVGTLDPTVRGLVQASDGHDLFVDLTGGGGFRLRSTAEIAASTQRLRDRLGMPAAWLAVAGPVGFTEHVVLDPREGVRYAHERDEPEDWPVVAPDYEAFLRELLAREGALYWWE